MEMSMNCETYANCELYLAHREMLRYLITYANERESTRQVTELIIRRESQILNARNNIDLLDFQIPEKYESQIDLSSINNKLIIKLLGVHSECLHLGNIIGNTELHALHKIRIDQLTNVLANNNILKSIETGESTQQYENLLNMVRIVL